MRLGLKWKYVWFPKVGPFTIPARGQVQLPSQDYTFSAPEGVLLTFSAGFDHPNCGIRGEWAPNLDTGDLFTVQQVGSFGFVDQPFYVTAFIPPVTPPGIYVIAMSKEWAWKETMRLYVINNDSIAHTCLGFAYTIATLDEPRPDDRLVPLRDMARVQQMLELYPELREPLRRRLKDEVEQFIEDMKLKVKLEAG
jgi:hypothetical protein